MGQMARLPFLIEHGELVWEVIAALAAALAIAVVRRVHARWEQRATARELAARAAQTTAPVEGVATIRGTLRGGRARSVSLLHLRGQRPYYDERAPALWLDCDGARVTLDGAIRVIRGTRAVSTRDRRSAVPDDELAVRSSPILHRLAALSVSARDGDAVFVTARLARGPGDDGFSYREATTAWVATPAGGVTGGAAGGAAGGAIELVAAAPVVRAMPLGAARGVASGVAGAALALAALWGAGQAAMWRMQAADAAVDDRGADRRVPAALDELDAAALAAATPGHRGDALAALEARFATRYDRTAESFAQWRRIARLRRGCGGEIAARIAQDEIDGLQALAGRCDDDAAAADALQFLGLFREAVERDSPLPPDGRHIESLIAVHQWEHAAWWAGSHDAADLPATVTPAAFACAERWYRWLAGDYASEVPEMPGAARDPVCAVFAALAPQGSERARTAALAAIPDPRLRQIGDALVGARPAAPGDPGPRAGAGIAPGSPDVDPADRATVALAMLSVRTGDPLGSGPGSPAQADRAAWRSIHAMLLDARRSARWWAWRAGRAASDRPLPRVADDPRDLALRAAQTGDARELTGALASRRLPGPRIVEALFTAWPRLRGGRDALAEVVRRIDLGPPAADPLAAIGRAAMRRDLARLVGDAAAADAWQAIIDRHVRAFSSDSALTALLVRELLRPAAP